MTAATAVPQAFDADRPWRLHPRVALRPEPFGALAYHYGNRRLTFLRSPDLVALVEALPASPSARTAFAAAGLDPRRWPSFDKALTSLAAGEFLVPGDSVDPVDPVGGAAQDTDADRARTGDARETDELTEPTDPTGDHR